MLIADEINVHHHKYVMFRRCYKNKEYLPPETALEEIYEPAE